MTPSLSITVQGFSQKAHFTFADAPQASHLFFGMSPQYKGSVSFAPGDA